MPRMASRASGEEEAGCRLENAPWMVRDSSFKAPVAQLVETQRYAMPRMASRASGEEEAGCRLENAPWMVRDSSFKAPVAQLVETRALCDASNGIACERRGGGRMPTGKRTMDGS